MPTLKKIPVHRITSFDEKTSTSTMVLIGYIHDVGRKKGWKICPEPHIKIDKKTPKYYQCSTDALDALTNLDDLYQ